MTGREQKVYYSYSQISHKHNIPDDGLPPQSQPLPLSGKEAKAPGFALPELEHNLQLLIDLTEQEIIQNDRQLQYERDMVVNLSHELEKMSEVLDHEERVISNLSKVLQLVEECERRMQPGCSHPLTLDECARVFETLQDKYYEEYRMSDRVDLAVAIVYPLMKEYFKEWDPLKVSRRGSRPRLCLGCQLAGGARGLPKAASHCSPPLRTARTAPRSSPSGRASWRMTSFCRTAARTCRRTPFTGGQAGDRGAICPGEMGGRRSRPSAHAGTAGGFSPHSLLHPTLVKYLLRFMGVPG